SFNVIVNDNIAPVITGCPTDITVSLPVSGCLKEVTWTSPTATDNCTLTSFTSNYESGDLFPLETTLVTYIATDNNANISTCSFNVIVSDTANPIIMGCPNDITAN